MRSNLPGQIDIPGTSVEAKGQIRLRAATPLRPNKPQLPCDLGLFSDDADQMDLIEMFMD